MKKRLVCFLVLFIALSSSVSFAQKKEPQEPAKAIDSVKLKGYPVSPFKDTLFYIYNRVGSFSAEDRANTITGKIKKIYEDSFFDTDSIQVVPSDITQDIVYKGDFVIMSVLDIDAQSEKQSAAYLAKRNLNLIKKAIIGQNENHSQLPKRLGYTVLLILIVGFILFFVGKIFNRVKLYILKNSDKHFKGFVYNNITMLSPQRQQFVVMRLYGFVKIIALILIVYFSLPLLFSIFPATEDYTTTLLRWVLSPAKLAFLGFVGFLPSLFAIIVIIVIFKYALKIIKFFFDEIKKENIKIDGFYSDWAMPTFNIIRFLMMAFMLVIIFPYLPGSDSPIFKGVSVFVGVLFSLGSSNAIANMVAGLVITYMRPFKIGDFIKIGDVSGEVIEKTALVTRVRTPKFEDITIPNATVLSSTSTNFSANTKNASNGLLIHTTVTIGYDVPWKDIHKALIEAALKTDMIEQTPTPFVLQTSLDDFYVSYQVNVYTKEPTKQPRIYSSLHQNIQDSFNAAGIEIMSPHYKALRDGNTTTIPENYLKTDYEAPTFNVKNKS
ncbi:mechanosensitive ion channel family protein [Flavobacterium sp. Fl-318]|uniref:Mechanosensitive ion channel family protein n=1 Tax=Flavobacterium cupriresistens TaxID=2893885 RepID=A0ABU4R6S8_9FLAO|nr:MULTISPECIES: mechanosensitive ion channel family protein [unclassified Flavobacterium]MDX6188294.1 mechanosensitive ion channel family protein [Flavobacterium sp. Fl-318]UFH40665.1 mechanosensitive ion channel family protein [Flavobacterium sp. F-323]